MKRSLFLILLITLPLALEAHANPWPEVHGKVIAEEPLPSNAELTIKGFDAGDGCISSSFNGKYNGPIKIQADGSYVIPAIDVAFANGESPVVQISVEGNSNSDFWFRAGAYYGSFDFDRFVKNVSSYTYKKLFRSTSVAVRWGDRTLSEYVEEVIHSHNVLANRLDLENTQFSGYRWSIFSTWPIAATEFDRVSGCEMPYGILPLGLAPAGDLPHLKIPDTNSSKSGSLRELLVEEPDHALLMPTQFVQICSPRQVLNQNEIFLDFCPKDPNRGCFARVKIAEISGRPLNEPSNLVNLNLIEPSDIQDIERQTDR